MATEGFDVRISLQRLLVGLILSIVPLSILGFYITAYSEKAVELSVGSQFKIFADSKAGQIGQSVNDLVVVMCALASVPDRKRRARPMQPTGQQITDLATGQEMREEARERSI